MAAKYISILDINTCITGLAGTLKLLVNFVAARRLKKMFYWSSKRNLRLCVFLEKKCREIFSTKLRQFEILDLELI